MISNRIAAMLCIAVCFCVSCDNEALGPADTGDIPGDNENRVTIDQGIWGEVRFWKGNFMPVVYPDVASGQISPVIRTIFIHEATRGDQVEWTYQEVEPCCGVSLISKIYTDLVAVTRSDDRGFFQIELPPGRYSIFVEEYGYLYANRFDGEYIFPVEVREGDVKGIVFDITYMAYF
jgi:hypothetical protein